MNYSVEIVINRPIASVVKIFDNPGYQSVWIDNLLDYKLISGTPGYRGAKSRYIKARGNREVEYIETVMVRNLPKEYIATYEGNGAFNISTTKFIALNDYTTKYISDQEYHYKGIMKYFIFFCCKKNKRRTKNQLKTFKAFVESRR